MTNQPNVNVKEAEKRAQTRAITAEIRIMEQEAKQAAERERQAEQARRERDANIEHIIVNDLAKLKPLYQKRQEAFDRLAAVLDDFMQLERKIMPELNMARERIPNMSSMYPGHLRERWVILALRAGIPTDHDYFSGMHPLAKTVAFGLINGHILPGQIAAGKSTLNIEV